jgi:hypothetical protein
MVKERAKQLLLLETATRRLWWSPTACGQVKIYYQAVDSTPDRGVANMVKYNNMMPTDLTLNQYTPHLNLVRTKYDDEQIHLPDEQVVRLCGGEQSQQQ